MVHLPTTTPSSSWNREQAIRNHRTITTSKSVKKFLLANVKVIIAFLIGVFVGSLGRTVDHYHQAVLLPPKSITTTRQNTIQQVVTTTTATSPSITTGSIYRLNDIPITNTSHKDKYGRPITKQQFVKPFQINTIAGFSVATLQPGQQVEIHDHESMHEFFYILEGRASFLMRKLENAEEGDDDKDSHLDEVEVSSGTFLHFPPHARHGIRVDDESPHGAMRMLIAGVVVPENEEKGAAT